MKLWCSLRKNERLKWLRVDQWKIIFRDRRALSKTGRNRKRLELHWSYPLLISWIIRKTH